MLFCVLEEKGRSTEGCRRHRRDKSGSKFLAAVNHRVEDLFEHCAVNHRAEYNKILGKIVTIVQVVSKFIDSIYI